MRLNAIAIDDEPLALEVIRGFLDRIDFIQLMECFSKPTAAMGFLRRESIDLLFMDIQMPDISGIDFIRALPQSPMVIFTTAYSEHAVQCFELDAIDYLLKPFSFPRFLKACNKAAELSTVKQRVAIADPVPATLFIKSGYEHLRVELPSILYIEGTGNYVQFILTGRKVTARMTMSDAEKMLPAGGFLRIHRSYLVAKNKITKVDKHSVWLDSVELPIGDAFQAAIENLLRNP